MPWIEYFCTFIFVKYIKFRNKRFPLRELKHAEFNTIVISTVELNNLLMTKTGGYVSKEAEAIDDRIYYYVESYQFIRSDKKLLKLIVEEANA